MPEPTSNSQRSAIRATHGVTNDLETEVRWTLEEGEMAVAYPSDSIGDAGYVEPR